MRAFHTIAVPHKDILEGRLTMDVFAANLWNVYKDKGVDEYKDAETFFKKTYLTQGLQNLLDIVEKRLGGKGGDAVIQITTPFGGGKTHALIAMYHSAVKWNAKKVVLVGTAFDPNKTTLWEELERQLTGSVKLMKGKTAPGTDAIMELLSEHQPVLVLMDEVLEYVTKAAGVQIGSSNLAAQTMAFMQELTETASTMERVCVVVTLPASIMEHYDQQAERLFQQLQKVSGRVEKIYTPIQEQEISKIIRRRLFTTINDSALKGIVSDTIDFYEKEGLLPSGVQPSEYRNRFMDSYPFTPEVIDVLYHRWGSYPTFQRTRGVLRLLSLVIYSLKSSQKSFITLADFDLSNQEIRQELLKHIGAEYNSVIAADISDKTAGSKKVDVSLGNAYQGLSLGSRSATTIFMYSFSGGSERGTTLGEIKREATTIENPSSVIAEAVEQLNAKLFYLQHVGDHYYFKNQPNVNRIILTKMENIKDKVLVENEREYLKEVLKGGKLRTFIWEDNAGDIADNEELKLVVLKQENKDLVDHITKNKGMTPRVYRNTLFFLYPLESERPSFIESLKRSLAYGEIVKDKELSLPEDQKKEISKEFEKSKKNLKEAIQRLYRIITIPGKEPDDLGIPAYGDDRGLDQKIYEKLKADGDILEKIVPKFIREKYLSKKDYVLTEQIYQSSLKTPGEPRITNRSVLIDAIREGVQNGTYGIGDLEDNKPVCKAFKKSTSAELVGNEIIISEAICKIQIEPPKQAPIDKPWEKEGGQVVSTTVSGGNGSQTVKPDVKTKESLCIEFEIPDGRVSGIVSIINYLKSKYKVVKIKVETTDGSITEQDYDDKILEAFDQLGIELKEKMG